MFISPVSPNSCTSCNILHGTRVIFRHWISWLSHWSYFSYGLHKQFAVACKLCVCKWGLELQNGLTPTWWINDGNLPEQISEDVSENNSQHHKSSNYSLAGQEAAYSPKWVKTILQFISSIVIMSRLLWPRDLPESHAALHLAFQHGFTDGLCTLQIR